MKKILIIISLFLFSLNTFAQSEKKVTLFVDGLCGMCKDRIEAAALKTKGVLKADWDMSSKILTVNVNTEIFKESNLHKKIAAVGHDTEKIKADDKVYDKLHSCCKYRGEAYEQKKEEKEHEGHKHDEHSEHDGHDHSKTSSHNESEANHEEHENNISGKINELSTNGSLEAVVGASVYWAGTTSGTLSNENGEFQLTKLGETNRLVISFVGYSNDTILINEYNFLELTLKKGIEMEEIDVVYKRKTTEMSFTNSIKLMTINQEELKKAACCNLSESFDTNPTIDVSFTDAITGTKQIQMLGLSGAYVQTTRENIPDVRGLAVLQGLNYTPGPWIQSIQLNTGTGSVINGYESITGQINVEIKKPQDSERIYLNIYANSENKIEANLNTRIKFNDKWSTGLLVHGSFLNTEWDMNDDNFIDHPTMNQKIALSRTTYQHNGWHIDLGLKGTISDIKSGQLSSLNQTNLWQSEMNTQRIESWLKVGKVLDFEQFTSFGFQTSVTLHQQDAFFGARNYDANQNTFYTNLIIERELKAKGNEIKTGISFQADKLNENVVAFDYLRNEKVPGIFLEHTYSKNPKFTLVTGLRADLHSNYGIFFTPRLHIRYAPSEQTVIRLSGGKGWRTASIFAENIGMFASNRTIIVQSEDTENPYGLSPEVAYNLGFNFAQTLYLGSKELVVSIDLYRTQFQNKIIANYDVSPQEINFYNLKGESFANSIQIQIDLELFENFNTRLAYRFNDTKTNFNQDQLETTPLTSTHRAFINMSYSTKKEWNFDLTVNYQGKKRIPNTSSNPEIYQLQEFSPAFFLTNGQISKHWKKFELYLGVENLFNFVQENPIISVENHDSEYFDASLIWGPILGRKTYGGLRFFIK
jgi:outer membrane receptor for ferrienterochelin and colicin/copper chaperone CopZ